MNPLDERIGSIWGQQRAILDRCLAAKRPLDADEKAEVERLDRELDAATEQRDRVHRDPFGETLRLLELADGPNGPTKRVESDLRAARDYLVEQHAGSDDASIRGVVAALADAPLSAQRGLLTDLQKYLKRREHIRAANTFKDQYQMSETAAIAPDLEAVAPITSRLFDAKNDRELRSILTSTSSSALATTRYWSTFESYLANASAALQSGVRVIDIDTTTLHVPAGTALATGAWLAEGGTAVASDMGVVGRTVTPARLTVHSEFSREVLEDASFPIFEAISKSMFDALGQLLDAAVFEGTGASNEPQGMLNLAGSSTASSGGTAVDLGYFVEMMENSLTANAPVRAWVTNPAAWGVYADLKTGGTAGYDLTPLLQSSQNTGGAAIAGQVLGKDLYITGNVDSLGAGTAAMYGFDPSLVWIVRRRDFRMIEDPYSKAEQGIVRFILEGRFGVHFPQPGAIQVATVLTP